MILIINRIAVKTICWNTIKVQHILVELNPVLIYRLYNVQYRNRTTFTPLSQGQKEMEEHTQKKALLVEIVHDDIQSIPVARRAFTFMNLLYVNELRPMQNRTTRFLV